MSTIFDNEKLDFDCPTCGNKISETIGRLNRGDYSCPVCGSVFETTALRWEIEKMNRLTADALRKLGNIKL